MGHRVAPVTLFSNGVSKFSYHIIEHLKGIYSAFFSVPPFHPQQHAPP
jgi:hypothetical protein